MTPFLPAMRFMATVLLTSVLLLTPAMGKSEPGAALDTTVQYLIEYVSGSGLTFIRNASSYSSAEAAEHMNAKYQHFKNDIETPEDFIERCASKSLISGKPYLVIDERGEKIRTSEWLNAALSEYRAANGGALRLSPPGHP